MLPGIKIIYTFKGFLVQYVRYKFYSKLCNDKFTKKRFSRKKLPRKSGDTELSKNASWQSLANWLLLHHAMFTARKRSLGQGNVFTTVCSQGRGSASKGICLRRPASGGGGSASGEFCIQERGVCITHQWHWADLPPPPPRELEKWAVHIILEYFLVFFCTGRERLIRSHSSARFSFELSGNSN